MEWWAWLIVGVLALAGVLVVAILFARASERHKERMATDPSYRYEVERKALSKDLSGAERHHRSAVAKAERALKEARKDAVQASISKVKLTPLTVIIGQVTQPLSVNSTFQLDVDGQVQAVAGHRLGGKRMAAGALIAGPAGLAVGALAQKSTVKREDTREVYLTVRDLKWGEVIKLQPTDIEAAKKFVLAAEIAVNKLEESAEAKVKRVAAAEKSLAETKANTEAIEAAELALARHEERAD